MIKANYHTHVKLCCHAEGMCDDYAKAAIKYGYKILGMSDHGPISRSFMTPEEYRYHWLERQMTYDEFINIYLEDARKTKELYRNKLEFLVGLEIEYLKPFHEYFETIRKELDYMSLGLHFFYHSDKIINSFDDVTYENVYSYALNAKSAMETGLYNIMVHPDVYLYHYKGKDGTTKFDEECEKTARLIIESAISNNVYLEINVGGVFKVTSAKEEVGKFAYPRDEFWEIAKEYKDLKIIIGVDAHMPSQLNAKEIQMAEEFALKHGLKLHNYVDNIG